jgi:hypothetical protein
VSGCACRLILSTVVWQFRQTAECLPISLLHPPSCAPQHFHVPDVVPELSTEQVLASEWVRGVHIDKVSPHGGQPQGGLQAGAGRANSLGYMYARGLSTTTKATCLHI